MAAANIFRNLGLGAVTTISLAAATISAGKPDSTSVACQDSSNIEILPVLELRDYFGLQVEALDYWPNADRGWTLSLTGESYNRPALLVLGGAPYQTGYFLNGQLFEDPGLGILTTTISSADLSRVTFDPWNETAQHGHGSAARVAATGLFPTQTYHGGIETISDNTIGTDFDQNYYRGWLTGPIPGLNAGRFEGFAERRWLGDRRPAPNASEITPDGSSRLPNNSLEGWSFHGSAEYGLSTRVKLSAIGDFSKDEWQEYRQSWLLNSAHTPRYEDRAYQLSGRIDVEHNRTNHSGYWIEIGAGGSERYRGDGVIFKDYNNYRRPFVNPEAETSNLFYTDSADFTVIADSVEVRNGQIVGGYSRDVLFILNEADSYTIDTLSSPGDTTITAIFRGAPAYYEDFLHRKIDYIGLSGAWYQFINEHHTATLGVEGRRYTTRSFRNFEATTGYSQGRVNAYGFDINGDEYNGDDFNHRAKNPVIAAGYVQDKLRFGALTANVGVRLDYFSFDSPTLKNPRSPMDPDESLQNIDPNDDSPNDNIIDETDLNDSKSYLRFSPRVQLRYQATDATELHGSFGIYHDAPPFDVLYVDWAFMSARIQAGREFIYPSPSLEPERTHKWIVGFSHKISLTLRGGIDLFQFKSQHLPDVFVASPAYPSSYSYYLDYGEVNRRGGVAKLTVQPVPEWTSTIQYLYCESQAELALDRISQIGWSAPGLPADIPWRSNHKIVVTSSFQFGPDGGPKLGSIYPLGNSTLDVVFRHGSNQRYTLAQSSGEAFIGNALYLPDGPADGERMDDLWTIDLSFRRAFPIGRGLSLEAILLVKNLTDNENVSAVWLTSGEPNTTGFLSTPSGQQFIQTYGADIYQLKENDPMNYAPPRQVYFGLGVRF